MACDFCKKIWANKDEYQNQFKYNWDEKPAIVLDESNKPSLYVPVQSVVENLRGINNDLYHIQRYKLSRFWK